MSESTASSTGRTSRSRRATRAAVALFASIALLASGSLTLATAAQAAVPASISGTVTFSGDVPDFATVYAMTDNDVDGYWDYVGNADVDTDGAYTLTDLTPGTDYRLEFSAAGEYLTEYWNDAATVADGTSITLASNEQRTGIDAELQAGGTISGHLTFPGGVVPDNTYASALRSINDVSDAYWDEAAYAYVDSSGDYTIHKVVPGAYRVQFTADSFVTQYWNNVPTVESATDITVSAGSNITTINASMDAGARISGTITSAAGVPVTDVHVHVYRQAGGSFDGMGSVYPNSDGTYTLGGLAAGTYTLYFHDEDDTLPSQYYGGVTMESKASTFTVGAHQQLTGMNYAMQTYATVDPDPSATALVLNPASRAYGTASTASVVVGGTSTAPTGTVTLKDGATVVGTAALSGGTAAFTLSPTLSVGNHAITATYSGANKIKSSTSAVGTLTVTPAKASISAKLTKKKISKKTKGKVRVTVKATGVVPTGSITVKDGSKVVGKGKLVNGKVTVKLSKLKKGKHKLKAVYSGSTTVSNATSGKVTLTVKA